MLIAIKQPLLTVSHLTVSGRSDRVGRGVGLRREEFVQPPGAAHHAPVRLGGRPGPGLQLPDSDMESGRMAGGVVRPGS